MKKFLIALAVLFSFQIVHCQKAVKNLPKSAKDTTAKIELVAPDTIYLPLTQNQFLIIKQYLQNLINQTEEVQLLRSMEAEVKKQSKPKTKP